MVIVASPFTKAKRSNCDMLDRNELQTYASLKKMLHNFCYSSTQREGKHQHFFCTKTTISENHKKNSFYQVFSNSIGLVIMLTSAKTKTVGDFGE
ncbi:hypothetical protein YC2023_117343 [Brassica napus]